MQSACRTAVKLLEEDCPVPTKTGAHQRFESEDNPGGLIFWWALGENDLGALKVIERMRAPIFRNALTQPLHPARGNAAQNFFHEIASCNIGER